MKSVARPDPACCFPCHSPVLSRVSPRSRGAEMGRICSSGGGQGLTRSPPGQRGRSPMGLVEGAELR